MRLCARPGAHAIKCDPLGRDAARDYTSGVRRSREVRMRDAPMTLPGSEPRADLLARYKEVRGAVTAACEPLSAEDVGVQSMPDASPTKWHLAHTTWFYETFVLSDPAFGR